jgi:hypothetical membrane protein
MFSKGTDIMTTAITAATPSTCDPATRVTRSLLGYGVIAGPFYVAVSMTEALTRPGFDLSRHSWSLLSNGPYGWVHITTFIVTGLMVIGAATGLRRALGSAQRWVPRLIAGYGLSLVAAGLLRTDPALGFPTGTPAGPGHVSGHGAGHLVAGAIGFACLIAACVLVGRRFAAQGRRGWAAFSRVTGIVFLAAFAGIAASGGAVVFTLGFIVAVVLAFAWLSALSMQLYRSI